jgi:uncharacterized protein YecE (DUF72 family)
MRGPKSVPSADERPTTEGQKVDRRSSSRTPSPLQSNGRRPFPSSPAGNAREMTATTTRPRTRRGTRGRSGRREHLAIGCSGWNYDSWRGRLYPHGLGESRWLERYAQEFDTVEVNATFYRLPSRKAVEKWVEATPPGFTFAVKTSRYLTHVRRLRDLAPGVARFRERIEPLQRSRRLGPMLWQLPATFRRDDERLEDAAGELGPGRHAFEFRHESWFAPEVAEILCRHSIAFVTADSAKRAFPPAPETTEWSYTRLHDGRGRRGNYTERQLQDLARSIARQHGRAYVYFNNDWEGFAVDNARRLRELICP